jgi:hypothetical protein
MFSRLLAPNMASLVVTYALNTTINKKKFNLDNNYSPSCGAKNLMRGIAPSEKVLPLKGSWEACNPHQAVYLFVVV